MKYRKAQQLIAYTGTPLTDNKEPATLGAAVAGACIVGDQKDYGTPERKLYLYRLLRRVHSAADEFEMSSEDVSAIKHIAAQYMTNIAFGALVDALEQG